MKRYLVGVREVHVSYTAIEAESPEEALRKVADGEGDGVFCEYSHTMHKDLWSVEEEGDTFPSS